MSLLDSNIEIKLTPEILKNVWRLDRMTQALTFDPPTESVYSKGYHHNSYIEVWYPGSVYKGSLWKYAGTKLTTNMVYVSFLRDPNEINWMAREDMIFSDLTFDEFGMLMNAIKERNWDFLDLLYMHKPLFQHKQTDVYVNDYQDVLEFIESDLNKPDFK